MESTNITDDGEFMSYNFADNPILVAMLYTV